jgi:hypothetical protein
VNGVAGLAVGNAPFPLLSRFQEPGNHALRTAWQIEDGSGLGCIILDFGARLLIVSAVPD